MLERISGMRRGLGEKLMGIHNWVNEKSSKLR